jgi:hypothetical protein
MDPETASMIFILMFWMYVLGLSVRTHRQIKSAWEEQYELPVTEIQYGDDHREM